VFCLTGHRQKLLWPLSTTFLSAVDGKMASFPVCGENVSKQHRLHS